MCTRFRLSPLYVACQNGHEHIVKLLLSYGANINLCTENGVSPLCIAYQQEHESIVELLLNEGAT